jgi:hypothetical protein
MSGLCNTTYELSSGDSSTTTGQHPQKLTLKCWVTAKVTSRYCEIIEMVVKGKNSNSADMGSASISLSGTWDSNNAPHNSDWLRAVARMFNHLADNLDQLPTKNQIIAQMVANKLD